MWKKISEKLIDYPRKVRDFLQNDSEEEEIDLLNQEIQVESGSSIKNQSHFSQSYVSQQKSILSNSWLSDNSMFSTNKKSLNRSPLSELS